MSPTYGCTVRTTDCLSSMMERLIPWTLAAATTFGMAGSPAMDAVGLKTERWHLASLGPEFGGVVSAAMTGSPVIDDVAPQLHEEQAGADEEDGLEAVSFSLTRDAQVPLEAQMTILREAQSEAELAVAILQELRRDLNASQVSEYLDAVDRALQSTGQVARLDDVRRFVLGLQVTVISHIS